MRLVALLACLAMGCHGESVETPADATSDAPTGDAPTDGADTALVDAGNDTSDGTTDADSASDTKACASAHGPSMVPIDAVGTRYCIDVTEVSVAQFNEFLTAPGTPFDVPSFCTGLALARPAADPRAEVQNLPARDLQWCFAHAYCKWAGKRLCGQIGKPGFEVPTDGRSEWTFACQNGALATKYPYGPTYDAARCVTTGAPVAVGSTKTCHGTTPPFDALFDLTGNVAEYDNGVGFLLAGGASTVRGRGASYSDDAQPCTYGGDFAFSSSLPQVGFRCCADP